MKSDLEEFFRSIVELVRGINQDMAWAAWMALGAVLLILILLGVISLRWIHLGGLVGGSSARFLADQRKRVSWLKSHH